jgi:hypothetical protein
VVALGDNDLLYYPGKSFQTKSPFTLICAIGNHKSPVKTI